MCRTSEGNGRVSLDSRHLGISKTQGTSISTNINILGTIGLMNTVNTVYWFSALNLDMQNIHPVCHSTFSHWGGVGERERVLVI